MKEINSRDPHDNRTGSRENPDQAKGPRLSERLTAAERMVRRGSILADIGTDHAFLPIRLCLDGICPRAIAMDVRKGPLERAAAHIREYHLEHRIDVRLSDGLEKLEAGEATCAVLMGMGGMLICRLLNAYPEKTASLKELILGPQSDIGTVRKTLEELRFQIADEEMLLEDGKYYTLIRAENRQEAEGVFRLMDRAEVMYGPCLIRKRHPVLMDYLDGKEAVCRRILKGLEKASAGSAGSRRAEIEEELHLINEARRYMDHADERDIEPAGTGISAERG